MRSIHTGRLFIGRDFYQQILADQTEVLPPAELFILPDGRFDRGVALTTSPGARYVAVRRLGRALQLIFWLSTVSSM